MINFTKIGRYSYKNINLDEGEFKIIFEKLLNLYMILKMKQNLKLKEFWKKLRKSMIMGIRIKKYNVFRNNFPKINEKGYSKNIYKLFFNLHYFLIIYKLFFLIYKLFF